VTVAQEFLAAYGRFDADAAISYLTDDAIVQGRDMATGRDTPEQLRLTLANYRALGYQQTITDCEHANNSESGVSIQCAFDMQLMRSDEIGLGPYTDNYWVLTVRDGKIVSTWQEIPFASNGFFEQMWEPFGAWVSIYHPDNVLTMYIDETKSMQRFTEESNRLWEQRIPEYIADVKQNPAAHLDQPKVAAYVAELDSICGAAQARVKNEIQAIPQSNQPAVNEARERIMGQTIFELRALPLPEAVRWPYEGRAFPLIETLFSKYPHRGQPPESLPRQIQQIPGLDKCIFPI
jgi:hypothetical protein